MGTSCTADKFYKLPQDLTSRPDITPSAKIVFAVIADSIGRNGKSWIGKRKIALRAGLAECTVIESITRLESAGILFVERRGNGKSNLYSLPESGLESRPVGKPDRSEKPTPGGRKTRPEAVGKPDPNQTDLLNQTYDCRKPDTEIFLKLPCKGKPPEFDLPKSKLKEYQQTYDTLDVERELKKARQWLVDNPRRRKTAQGMPRFLGNWLLRATNKPTEKGYPGCPSGVVPYEFGGNYVRPGNETDERIRREKMGLV